MPDTDIMRVRLTDEEIINGTIYSGLDGGYGPRALSFHRRGGCGEKNRRGCGGRRGKLLGWLRAKLGARGQEALDDLAARPDSEDNQADLRKQIQKALEADPALAQQLEALVRTGGVTADSMVQDVSGAGAKAAQVNGPGNTTTIS